MRWWNAVPQSDLKVGRKRQPASNPMNSMTTFPNEGSNKCARRKSVTSIEEAWLLAAVGAFCIWTASNCDGGIEVDAFITDPLSGKVFVINTATNMTVGFDAADQTPLLRQHKVTIARSGVMTPLYKGEMNLWISSRPEQFSSQIVQEFHQDFPAFNLRDKSFSPDAFSGAISENAKDESYPDVAFIGNDRELEPLIAAKAVWQNWGQTGRFDANGWWVIFRDAKHVDQARAFFR
jgi:hypothetical protein